MFYDLSMRKTIIFSLIILVMASGILASHALKRALGEDYLSITAARTRLEVDRLVYDFKFTYKENGDLFASAITAVGLGSDKISILSTDNGEKATSIPVLLYHGIVEEPDGENVLLENFEAQMHALKKNGWNTVSMEDFNAFIHGDKELPDKSFLLTFDDGRKDSYYSVDPILKALDYRAVNFIITGRSLEESNRHHPFTLTRWELQDMVNSGRWDIQSHGKYDHEMYPVDQYERLGHFMSNKLWLKDKGRLETEEEFKTRIREDLSISKKELEEQLGINIYTYAFPFSDFGQDTVNFKESKPLILDAVKSEYKLGFYQLWDGVGDTFNYPSDEDFTMIKRITINYDWKTSDLLDVLDKGEAKSPLYSDNFSMNHGWIKTWGMMKIDNNSLILGGSNDRSGGSAFLDGSYSWKNYTFRASIESIKGSSVSLLARYQDDENYVSCVFTPEFVRIEQVTNGNREILADQEIKIMDIAGTGIRVYENEVDCLLAGENTASGVITNPDFTRGGIALRTWDAIVNNSQITVNNISITQE